MDALKIPTAVLAGYDWGGRAACVVAALWPERCTAVSCKKVSVTARVSADAEPGRATRHRRNLSIVRSRKYLVVEPFPVGRSGRQLVFRCVKRR